MKFTIPLLALILILAACQPTAAPTETLPTLAVLSASATAEATETAAATEAQTAEITAEATAESSVEATEAVNLPDMPTDTPQPTNTATVTPRPVTATHTVEPTLAAVGTATQAVLEAPRYATFTAAPLGTLPPTS